MSDVVLRSAEEGHPYRRLVESFGSPLLVLDAERLRAGYRALCRCLPGVRIYYAVKSLPEPAVVRILAEEGASFDLASAGEITLVQALGVAGRETIHTHPIKTDREIRTALRFGCTTFVVDNGFEIQKFVRYRHRVGLLLRVSFRNPNARVDLSRKFGCDLGQVPELLAQAERLGIHVKGLSFHVGSQCPTPDGHVAAIATCAELIERSQALDRDPMSVLDIGGGFPVDYEHGAQGGAGLLEAFCVPVGAALARLPRQIDVIAEPGRCLSAPPVSLITSVVGKSERDGRAWFYLDDGVYGAFSGQIYDGTRYPLTFFAGPATCPDAVLAGPTCDSVDIVRERVDTPDFGLGDIIVATQIGAYASASATEFNSLPRTRMVVLEEGAGEDATRAGGAPKRS